MTPLIPIALFGWPAAVLVLFAILQARVAVLVSYLGAWLFLPMAAYEYAGLPGYGKMEAASYGVLAGVILFDSARLGQLRLNRFDLPIAVWCVSPFFTSVLNGLGAYDGASMAYGQVISWGVPYLMGRLYFSDMEGLKALAIAVVIGGLLYVPLCLFEIRMSPRLHIWVYGFHQHSWGQSHRFGGWRPTVFMQHGLAVAMWMTTASIVALWMWWSGALRGLWGIPLGYIAAALSTTTVLCKSIGAIALLAIGAAAMASVKKLRSGVVVSLLLLAPVMYMGFRALGVWDAAQLMSLADAVAPSREGSLRYRLEAENILSEHAMRRPFFGWGTHSRNRPSSMGYGVENIATDGFWIITFGQQGAVGLVSVAALILLPAWMLFRRTPPSLWSSREVGPVFALALCLVLFMVDSLFNAMMNPVYAVIAGGLCGATSVGALRPGFARPARVASRDSAILASRMAHKTYS